MELSFMDQTGARIRYYRTKAGMTQKQLADACGISDPAIRNYELGNRIPSYDTLMDISEVLGVSYYALAEPQIPPFGGAMQILFRMEQAYGLSPVMIDGKPSLQINPGTQPPEPDYFGMMLREWLKAHALLEEGKWTLDDYLTWESIYPYSNESAFSHPLAAELKGKAAAAKLPEDKPEVPKKRGRKPKKDGGKTSGKK